MSVSIEPILTPEARENLFQLLRSGKDNGAEVAKIIRAGTVIAQEPVVSALLGITCPPLPTTGWNVLQEKK